MELTATELTQLKQLQLNMLRQFVDVCRQLNLRYYLMGGTMLGAVRHGGFIPWDDDIDVGMPRQDYEVFLQKAQSLLPENLFVQTFETDPQYPANFAKIRNSDTTFVETSVKKRRMNHGVYMDIFPLDYYPDEKEKSFENKKLLLTLRINRVYSDVHPKFTTRLASLAACVACPSVQKALQKREKLFRSVTSGSRIANHCGAWGKKEIVPADWYGEGTTLAFEGIPVTVPAQYDKWLTHVYGDYMQLPPEEKRKSHHFLAAFDLAKPYTCYNEENL